MPARSSLSADPFASGALNSPFGGNSLGTSSLAHDPFSPSVLPHVSSPPPPASRIFPASPFDPSLPPVAKSAEVGPNILDARQFDPFQVVNL